MQKTVIAELTNEQSLLVTNAIDDIKADFLPKYKIIKRLGDELEKTGIPKSSVTKTIKAVLTVPRPVDEKTWPKGYAGKDYISRCFDSSYKDYSMWHLSGDGGEEKLSEIKEKMSKKQQANAAKLHKKKPIAKGDIVLTGIKKEKPKPKPKKEKIKIKKQQKPKIEAATAVIAGLDVARKREKKQQKGELIKKAIEDEEKQFKELKPIKASAGTGKETIFYEGAKVEPISEAEAVIDISIPLSTIDSELSKKVKELEHHIELLVADNKGLVDLADNLRHERDALKTKLADALTNENTNMEIGSKAADNLIAELESKLKETSKPFKSRHWLTVKLGGKEDKEPVFTIIQYDAIAVPETRQLNVPPNLMKRVSPEEKENNRLAWEKESKGRKSVDIDIKAEAASQE
jgi:hypothetical protein